MNSGIYTLISQLHLATGVQGSQIIIAILTKTRLKCTEIMENGTIAKVTLEELQFASKIDFSFIINYL